jgi:hypothetical protein
MQRLCGWRRPESIPRTNNSAQDRWRLRGLLRPLQPGKVKSGKIYTKLFDPPPFCNAFRNGGWGHEKRYETPEYWQFPNLSQIHYGVDMSIAGDRVFSASLADSGRSSALHLFGTAAATSCSSDGAGADVIIQCFANRPLDSQARRRCIQFQRNSKHDRRSTATSRVRPYQGVFMMSRSRILVVTVLSMLVTSSATMAWNPFRRETPREASRPGASTPSPADQRLLTVAKAAVREYLTQRGVLSSDIPRMDAKVLGGGRVGVSAQVNHEFGAMWHNFYYDTKTGEVTRKN